MWPRLSTIIGVVGGVAGELGVGLLQQVVGKYLRGLGGPEGFPGRRGGYVSLLGYDLDGVLDRYAGDGGFGSEPYSEPVTVSRPPLQQGCVQAGAGAVVDHYPVAGFQGLQPGAH